MGDPTVGTWEQKIGRQVRFVADPTELKKFDSWGRIYPGKYVAFDAGAISYYRKGDWIIGMVVQVGYPAQGSGRFVRVEYGYPEAFEVFTKLDHLRNVPWIELDLKNLGGK